jgi:hypothetical protein
MRLAVKNAEIEGEKKQNESSESNPDNHHDLLVAVSLHPPPPASRMGCGATGRYRIRREPKPRADDVSIPLMRVATPYRMDASTSAAHAY